MTASRSTKTRWRTVTEWLNHPLSAVGCLIGWICAFVVFIGFTSLLGGPTEFDAALSVYSTWSLATGHLACSYVNVGHLHVSPVGNPFTLIAPVYPLFSGVVLAITTRRELRRISDDLATWSALLHGDIGDVPLVRSFERDPRNGASRLFQLDLRPVRRGRVTSVHRAQAGPIGSH